MTAAAHDHNGACGTCNRPIGCPECYRPWPDGNPGYYDAAIGGWRSGPRPAPAKPDKALEAAQQVLDQAQADYDQRRAEWEAAIAARAQHELSMASGPTVMLSSGVMSTPNNTPAARAKLHQLKEAEAAAKEALQAAGPQVVKARQALRALASRAVTT